MSGLPLPDTRPVRPTEELDWPRLEAYLREHLRTQEIASFDASCEMEVRQFPGGHSNLTYLVRFGGVELVLRRPPFGPVAPTAHDMAREYRWLAAVHPVFPLAPQPYLLCDDASIIEHHRASSSILGGSIFYVMERRRGLVVRHDDAPAWAAWAASSDRPDVCRGVSQALVDTLAALHAIDVAKPGLAGLGKPAGFVERQVRGWTERWHRSKIAPVREMEELAAWLRDRVPPDPVKASIVHGDFKLDNVMLDPADVSRIVAVLDWEMSALGDPLVDLGLLLAYWPPGAPGERSALPDRSGWFTRDEIVERYAERSEQDLSAIRFYETFALFKVAVIIQQIFYRYACGQTDDARFADFGESIQALAREATTLAREDT